jgi:hypothetical protein
LRPPRLLNSAVSASQSCFAASISSLRSRFIRPVAPPSDHSPAIQPPIRQSAGLLTNLLPGENLFGAPSSERRIGLDRAGRLRLGLRSHESYEQKNQEHRPMEKFIRIIGTLTSRTRKGQERQKHEGCPAQTKLQKLNAHPLSALRADWPVRERPAGMIKSASRATPTVTTTPISVYPAKNLSANDPSPPRARQSLRQKLDRRHRSQCTSIPAMTEVAFPSSKTHKPSPLKRPARQSPNQTTRSKRTPPGGSNMRSQSAPLPKHSQTLLKVSSEPS